MVIGLFNLGGVRQTPSQHSSSRSHVIVVIVTLVIIIVIATLVIIIVIATLVTFESYEFSRMEGHPSRHNQDFLRRA
jgi:hypothetical protein